MLRMTLAALLAGSMVAAAQDAAPLHGAWDALLQQHVKGGLVDYAALKAQPAALDAYLRALADTDPGTSSRDEQLAYWINAYNAFTVKLILNHYPLKSIRDIDRPWKQKAWKAGGKLYSLDEIEHEILRKRLKEPRIHFAIVCASIGCPSLLDSAYMPGKVDRQLHESAIRFFRSPRHVQTETTQSWGRRKHVLKLNKIMDWFKGDFTAGNRPVQTYVQEYVDKQTAEFVRSAGDELKIEYLAYDWDLNEHK